MYPESLSSTIFQDGIYNARKHGIQVVSDNPNRAEGDCLFEAVRDNINNRDCFLDKLKNKVQYYREDWVTELMLKYEKTDHYRKEDEEAWHAAWDRQMDPGVYNVDEFSVSDLVPAGLGHCLKKDILVFNVDLNSNSPVQVYPANIFNIPPTTEIPIVIVYNGGHYESLLPQSEQDIRNCINLVKAVKNNEYIKETPMGYLVNKSLEDKNGTEEKYKNSSKQALHIHKASKHKDTSIHKCEEEGCKATCSCKKFTKAQEK